MKNKYKFFTALSGEQQSKAIEVNRFINVDPVSFWERPIVEKYEGMLSWLGYTHASITCGGFNRQGSKGAVCNTILRGAPDIGQIVSKMPDSVALELARTPQQIADAVAKAIIQQVQDIEEKLLDDLRIEYAQLIADETIAHTMIVKGYKINVETLEVYYD